MNKRAERRVDYLIMKGQGGECLIMKGARARAVKEEGRRGEETLVITISSSHLELL